MTIKKIYPSCCLLILTAFSSQIAYPIPFDKVSAIPDSKYALNWEPEIRVLKKDDRNILMAFHAIPEGKLAESITPQLRTKQTFEGYAFRNSDDSLTWVVEVPEEAEYEAHILYEKPVTSEAKSFLEVEANGRLSRIIPINAKIPDGPGRLRYRRHKLESDYKLKKGLNLIKVRMVPREATNDFMENIQFKIVSMELTRKAAVAGIEKRASELESDISWMIGGKYGLFTHWSPLTYPLYGNTRADETYEKGVNEFDVDAYVDTVVETGAAWVVFTSAHGPQFWPGPNKTLDGILPGRTAKRDLIGELADALAKKGIRLMLYYHHGRGDLEYMKASGMLDADPSRWFENVIAMHREVSERYGKRLWGSGAYMDGSFNVYYQYDFPFERLTRAMKSGNPDAIVGYSSDRGPRITPFSDIFVSDGNKWLAGPLPAEWYEPDGPYHGQNPAWFFFMDEWIPRKPLNGKFTADPAHSTEAYADYFKRMAEAKIPVTVNLLITQDVTRKQLFMNEKSLKIMRKVRKAIRGK